MTARPSIPTEAKRKLLIESGYRCAVPTCRFPITENAYIVSWLVSHDDSYENMIALCPNCHTMYDSGRIDRAAIIAYKKKLIFLNDVYSRFELDVIDHLKTHRRALIPGEILIKRLLDEGIVTLEEPIMTQEFDDGEIIPSIFSVILTDKGHTLIEAWSKIDKSLTHEQL